MALSRAAIEREYREMSQIADPDSSYWMGHAINVSGKLSDLMGGDTYRLWYETRFGGRADEYTWKEITQAHDFAINHMDIALGEIECVCSPDGMTCKPCRAAARIRARQLPETERI